MNPSDLQFSDFKLNKQVLEGISDLEYRNPTPIQRKVIPIAMAGHDILGIAPTGTGKTAAFLIPLIMKLRYPTANTPRALILLPTRELAIQVGNEALKFSKY